MEPEKKTAQNEDSEPVSPDTPEPVTENTVVSGPETVTQQTTSPDAAVDETKEETPDSEYHEKHIQWAKEAEDNARLLEELHKIIPVVSIKKIDNTNE